MASKALYNGQAKSPRQVPKDADIYCTECERPMKIIPAHTRSNVDGVVCRHFSHKADPGGGGDGGGGCPGGESDEHERWKGFAADALGELFEDRIAICCVEGELDAPVSEKQHREADALAVFNDPDPQLGRGVAIEVQHKNKSKDIPTTTSDYVRQGIAVVWTEADDYGDSRVRLNEADIRHRAREAAWPEEVPPASGAVTPVTHEYLPSAYTAATGETLSADLPAPTLPPDAVHSYGQTIYNNTPWESLFTDSLILDDLETIYVEATADRLNTDLPAVTLPPEYVDEVESQIFREQPWEELFSPPTQRMCFGEPWSLQVEIPFERWLVKEGGYEWTYHHPVSPADPPERPRTPYADVQCHQCGKYWYWDELRTVCQNCGGRVSYEWNAESGRISDDTFRKVQRRLNFILKPRRRSQAD